jgi:hypothetical protein
LYYPNIDQSTEEVIEEVPLPANIGWMGELEPRVIIEEDEFSLPSPNRSSASP